MLHPHVVKKESSGKGAGLFAVQPVKAGEVVWRLDPAEQRMTIQELQALPIERRNYAFQCKNRYVIASDGGQYINHGCDPSVWWEGDEQLVARRDIRVGEEITYDYATSDVTPAWTAPWRCQCGAANCRWRISTSDCLQAAFQEQYRGHLPSWILQFIRHRQEMAHDGASSGAAWRRMAAAFCMRCSTLCRQAASACVAVAAGVSDPEALVRQTREEWDSDYVFGQHDEAYVFSGVTKLEEAALEGIKPGGAIGVIGCGTGRAMIGLGQRGYAVDGVDIAPRMVDAAELYLAQAGVRGEVHCADIAAYAFPRPRYDLLIFSWLTYGAIPSATRRVAVLRWLSSYLHPDGCVAILYEPLRYKGRYLARMVRLAQWAAQLTRNTASFSPGDSFSQQLAYQHCFTRGEIEAEGREAGYDVVRHRDDGREAVAVFRPARFA